MIEDELERQLRNTESQLDDLRRRVARVQRAERLAAEVDRAEDELRARREREDRIRSQRRERAVAAIEREHHMTPPTVDLDRVSLSDMRIVSL